MRKLLNTLYITTDDAYLTEESDSVVIRQGSTKLGQFPLIAIENIMLFSFKGASPELLGKCAEKGIGVSQYTPNGKFLYRISDKNRGNVLLRKEQYRISDDGSRAMPYARNMILAKVYNQRNTVNRALRDHSMRIDKEKFTKVSNNLKKKMSDIENVSDIDALRGIEGDAAVDYFSVFDDMILNQKEDFAFNGRNRRPPLDNVNAMLSFLYAVLANDCADALEGVGLDSYVGFMHTDKPGRKSLALDLMEELRAPLVDRLVLTLINQRQITGDDFIKEESGAVRFTSDGRKKILKAWQEKKKMEITHPFLDEKLEWGLVAYVQALLLARVVRGDMDEYPPFLWK